MAVQRARHAGALKACAKYWMAAVGLRAASFQDSHGVTHHGQSLC